jgi:hypothetical protein
VELFPEYLASDQVLPYFIDWLLNNVDMVEITAYNDEDAYTIFETMNDRGKPLSPTDMLKGYLLACVGADDRKQELNELWAAEMRRLRALGKIEDIAFFRTWLRAQYAEGTRQRGANAKPQDFDRLGTEFHRVVRDEHERFGLRLGPDYDRFIAEQMVSFADHYLTLRGAEAAVTPGLEFVRYNAASGFGQQAMVCLAPLRPGDAPEEALAKMNAVAGYLETLIVRRVINWKSVSSNTMQYAMLLLLKDLRGLSLDELRDSLTQKATALEAELPWAAIKTWALHNQNGRHVRNLLARITSHIEAESAMGGPGFDGYVQRTGKDPFDIEHIWAAKPERHRDDFDTDTEFAAYRNRVGGLLLMPASFNRSYGAEPYSTKLGHYLGQNLLAKSLHPLAYEHHPGFERYAERTGLPFTSHESFRRVDLDQRQDLYQAICEEIFSARRFSASPDAAPAPVDTPGATPTAARGDGYRLQSATPEHLSPEGNSDRMDVMDSGPDATDYAADLWHGTMSGYTNHGCRCDRCRAAKAEYTTRYRDQRFAESSCRIEGCERVASRATGNGLCAHHHAELRTPAP